MEKSELRTLFESEYPGKKAIFENLIQPIFTKAKDTTLSKEMDITEGDKKQIKSFSIIAQVRGGFPITFADVEVKDTVALKRSRVNIQNCVRKMMANDSNAIIFFHFTDNKSEWRVSYCHRATTNKESTDAKRFTYLCGTEHACRTIAERFDTLQGLTTIKDDDMLEAFGVEPLSKEFFDQYRNHYADLVEYISGKRFIKKGGKFVEEKTKNANGAFKDAFGGDDKLVRDYVKKMMGRLVFLHFLQKKGWLGVAKDSSWGNGDKNFIFNLFENSSEDVKKDFLEQALEPLFFKTLNTDRGEDAIAPKAICDIYGSKIRIPYLNGGLFEEDELDKKKVKFKKEHFETLLEFFNQYNFTIDETDPEDQEIGVDPEMLGKIFENLLEDNKDKGAFYTPKEIVQYMCRESLIAYLEEKTKIDARAFVINHEVNFTDSQKADVSKALLDVKICDPAVGSGAFPMGMLNELLACTQLLVGDSKSRSYLKKHIVKNNIYGVDIEKGAVDIARLRFWLAIIVDEEEPIPLPNLDYKIMQGNSLLECYDGIDLSKMLEKPEDGLDYNEEQRELLKTNMDEYFDDNNHEDKNNKNEVIKALVYDLVCATCGYKPNSQKALEMQEKIWEGTTDFFLWHTWFNDVFNRPNDCNGFDIVIGNPPYIRVQNLEYTLIDQLKAGYETALKRIDISLCFIELASKLIHKSGTACFITSNQFLTTEYGKAMRAYLLNKFFVKQNIDMGDLPIFDSAMTYVSIFQFSKKRQEVMKYYPVSSMEHVFQMNYGVPELIDYKTLSDDNWNLKNYKMTSIYKKMKSNSVPLENIGHCNAGLITGCDKILMFSEKELSSLPFEKEILLPVLRAENCSKYSASKPQKYVIYPYYERDGKTFIYSEKELKEKFPKAYKYLKANEKELAERKDSRTTFAEKGNWYGLVRFGRKEMFNQPKIISPGEVQGHKFCLDYSKAGFSCARVFAITVENKNYDIKFVLAILNSEIMKSYIQSIASLKSGGYYQYSSNILNRCPIPSATKDQQRKIIDLVDKILLAKKKDSSSDTTQIESEIDKLVCNLYGLSPE